MIRPANAAFVDELPDQGDGRHAAVVEGHHIRHAGLLDRGDHLFALGRVHRQRLLADDHLAGRGGGQHDLFVKMIGEADIDQINVVAGNDFLPIIFNCLITPGFGKLFGLLGRIFPSAADLEHRLVLDGKEMADLQPGVGDALGP